MDRFIIQSERRDGEALLVTALILDQRVCFERRPDRDQWTDEGDIYFNTYGPVYRPVAGILIQKSDVSVDSSTGMDSGRRFFGIVDQSNQPIVLKELTELEIVQEAGEWPEETPSIRFRIKGLNGGDELVSISGEYRYGNTTPFCPVIMPRPHREGCHNFPRINWELLTSVSDDFWFAYALRPPDSTAGEIRAHCFPSDFQGHLQNLVVDH